MMIVWGIRLMASKIKQLRASFNKMLTAQKVQFIFNLKQKLQSNAIIEHTKILNDCIQKYNIVVRNGSQTVTTTPIKNIFDIDIATKKKTKQKNFLKNVVIVLNIVVVALIIFNGCGMESNDSKSDLAGVWENSKYDSDDNELFLMYEFSNDGRFHEFFGARSSGIARILTGHYILDDDIITLTCESRVAFSIYGHFGEDIWNESEYDRTETFTHSFSENHMKFYLTDEYENKQSYRKSDSFIETLNLWIAFNLSSSYDIWLSPVSEF